MVYLSRVVRFRLFPMWGMTCVTHFYTRLNQAGDMHHLACKHLVRFFASESIAKSFKQPHMRSLPNLKGFVQLAATAWGMFFLLVASTLSA